MASGYAAKVGHTLTSCTSEIESVRMRSLELSYVNVVLVDTPGFDDTNRSDVEVLRMISNWMRETFVIYVKK